MSSKSAYTVLVEENNEGNSKSKFIAHLSNLKKSVKRSIRTLKLVLPYFWPKGSENIFELRLRVFFGILAVISGRVVDLTLPFIYKAAIDRLTAPKITLPAGWIVLYGVVRLLSSNMNDIRDSIFVKVENYATRCVTLDAFTHIQYLSLSFHLNRKSGALLRIIDRGKTAVSELLSLLGFTLIPTLFEVVLVCIIMFISFGGWFSLMTFLCVVFYIIFTIIVTEWRSKYRRELNERENEASNNALDTLLNFETVKYFTAEKYLIKSYDNTLEKYFQSAVLRQYSLTFLNIGQVFFITLGIVGTFLLAAVDVEKGTMTIGDLIAINTFLTLLYTPLSWLGYQYRTIIDSFTDLENLFTLLDQHNDVKDDVNAKELKIEPGNGSVEFRSVVFSYPKRASSKDKEDEKEEEENIDTEASEISERIPILKGVSFKIPAGKTLAIVGHSGSGKTTIARLLCRFYDPESGSILIDGKDIRDVTQDSLRRSIGVVPQDTVLFNDTIFNNINFGRIGKENEIKMTVESAAKEVAIARTILRDPRILILDEATSALDSHTEKEIQASLMEVSKGRTTLIIAHRLSTVINADEILVMRGGQIIERGTHKELLELRGSYRELWEVQAKEAKEQSEKEAKSEIESPILDLS